MAQVLADTAQFWPFERCAFVTEVLTGPDGLSFHIWLGGGSLRAMVAEQETLAAWARWAGCEHATIIGRKGWGRALSGFEPNGDELRRRLWPKSNRAATAR